LIYHSISLMNKLSCIEKNRKNMERIEMINALLKKYRKFLTNKEEQKTSYPRLLYWTIDSTILSFT
jgi:hypothetical protein